MQVTDFKRMEARGITSIANIASKPPSDRGDTDKQFFVMFLKLKVPFFADFDKKTLKLVMERMVAQYYNSHTFIHKFNNEAEAVYIVISGQVGVYDE